MDRRVVRWGMAAGALVGIATSLLLFWASANAALLAAGLFLAALLTGLGFLSRVLVVEVAVGDRSSLERYARDSRT